MRTHLTNRKCEQNVGPMRRSNRFIVARLLAAARSTLAFAAPGVVRGGV